MLKRTRNALLRSALWTVLILVVWFNVAHIRYLKGTSMLRTLGEGAVVVVYELGSHFSPPKRGDIVCVQTNERPRQVYCKRVIALPGEELEFKNGIVYINGGKLDEPYALISNTWNKSKIKLDDRHVYVVGDNRGMSMAMHTQGQANLDNVLGVVEIVIRQGNIPDEVEATN